jgi:Ankyrin repeat
MPQQRAPLMRQLQTITESVKVDIDDVDLAGHTIINGYNPRDGELNIAANIVKYITAEYVKLEEKDAVGDSLLHTAATIGLPLVVLALLQHGANPNSVNKKGQSIWFSTALAFESVERALATQWEEGLHYQRGRLVDCLDLLERAPGFSMPHSSVPSISTAPGKDKVNFLYYTPQQYHVGHIQAAATSFKVFWPW